MPPEDLETLLQFFKALADENRLKLLGILAHGERSVEELAAQLQLKAPTVSHHLAKLKELGLVGMRTDKNTHYYWLNAEALRQSSKHLLTPEKAASLVENVEGDAWERKVVRDFFNGTQLKEIPASTKKRDVIIRWFADLFEYGVKYKEAQVNEIIQRHHPDFAFFRRELIGARLRLMQRDNNVYWRISPEFSNPKELRATLERIVERLEPYKEYSAAELDEIIARIHPDYPFLHRALVEENMLIYSNEWYVYLPNRRQPEQSSKGEE